MIKRVLLAAVLAFLGLSACGSDSGSKTTTGASSTDSVKIEASDFAFKPTELTVTADKASTIELKNGGAVEHNFTVDGTKVNQDVGAGKTSSIDFTAKAGRYPFHCKYHPDQMKGTITVS
jgi:plastocyanin